MDLQTLKLINLGVKRQPSTSQCGFSNDAIWMIDSSIVENSDKEKMAEVLCWWNMYITNNIECCIDIKTMINEGLRRLKETKYRESPIGVSIAAVYDRGTYLEVFLCGETGILLGTSSNLQIRLLDEENRRITDSILFDMKEYGSIYDIDVIKSRKYVVGELNIAVQRGYNLVRCNVGELQDNTFLNLTVDVGDSTNVSIVSKDILALEWYLEGVENIYKRSICTSYTDIVQEIKQLEVLDTGCNKYPRLRQKGNYALISVRIK